MSRHGTHFAKTDRLLLSSGRRFCQGSAAQRPRPSIHTVDPPGRVSPRTFGVCGWSELLRCQSVLSASKRASHDRFKKMQLILSLTTPTGTLVGRDHVSFKTLVQCRNSAFLPGLSVHQVRMKCSESHVSAPRFAVKTGGRALNL